MKPHTSPPRRDEQGIAIVIALFMMLAMSVLGTSLMFVSKTETLSSHNYRLMSQARYGAESGVHVAANYLLSTNYGAVMPGTAGDSLSNYTLTTSPVQYGGNPVVLSSTSTSSNYPVSSVKTAFASLFNGASLDVSDAPVRYKATATLKSMKQISDAFTNLPVVIQTWEIVGEGSVTGARDATIEVASVVERQTSPIYAYAAFATDNGCAALSFAGGATTNSYDSQNLNLVGGVPTTDNYSGNVGTNGNLTELGNTTVVQGALSTPRAGVGSCTTNNVTALTQTGGATVSYGLTQLSQNITFPTPPAPSPAPPTTSIGFTQNGGCPSGLGAACTASANGSTLDASAVGGTMTMGNVTTNGSSIVHFKAGTYIVNSLLMNGNSQIVVDSGPVIFKVAGTGQSTPITITGQGLVNSTFDPNLLRFEYGGTGEVKLAGGDKSAALFYAPNATSSISGGADLYGAIVVKKLTETGGAAIHYDRRLATTAMTAGNYMLSAFTWKSY